MATISAANMMDQIDENHAGADGREDHQGSGDILVDVVEKKVEHQSEKEKARGHHQVGEKALSEQR